MVCRMTKKRGYLMPAKSNKKKTIRFTGKAHNICHQYYCHTTTIKCISIMEGFTTQNKPFLIHWSCIRSNYTYKHSILRLVDFI